MFLKVCGITRLEDARYAIAHGATALGFILWDRSPRYVTPDQVAAIVAALPPPVTTVGVFVNEPIDGIRHVVAQTRLSAVQLHGDEPATYARALEMPLLRAVTIRDVDRVRDEWPPATTLLLDAADPVRRGGTGMRVDWASAAAAARKGRIVLAGGLTPENVQEAIRMVRPSGVDVSSGVESTPGVKDAGKVRAFLTNAQRAFDEVRSTEVSGS